MEANNDAAEEKFFFIKVDAYQRRGGLTKEDKDESNNIWSQKV